MVKEFGNSTENSSKGGFGRSKSVGPLSAPGRDTGGSSSSEEYPEETARTETQSSPCELDSWDC